MICESVKKWTDKTLTYLLYYTRGIKTYHVKDDKNRNVVSISVLNDRVLQIKIDENYQLKIKGG